MPLGIGSKVWHFDQNVRHFDDSRRVIYRHHWVETEIVGETSSRWLIKRGGFGSQPSPISKKAAETACREHRAVDSTKARSYGRDRYALTERTVEDDVWRNDELHRLRDELRAADVATLRRIDALLHPEKIVAPVPDLTPELLRVIGFSGGHYEGWDINEHCATSGGLPGALFRVWSERGRHGHGRYADRSGNRSVASRGARAVYSTPARAGQAVLAAFDLWVERRRSRLVKLIEEAVDVV